MKVSKFRGERRKWGQSEGGRDGRRTKEEIGPRTESFAEGEAITAVGESGTRREPPNE